LCVDLINYLEHQVPVVFPLYKLMRERNSAPLALEIAIAQGKRLLTDPDVTQYLHNAFGGVDVPAAFKVL
jgi:hypothetical protein